MTIYCVRVVMWDTVLNMFTHIFTCRLRVWNAVIFSASVKNEDARAVRGPDGSAGVCPKFWFLLHQIYSIYICYTHHCVKLIPL